MPSFLFPLQQWGNGRRDHSSACLNLSSRTPDMQRSLPTCDSPPQRRTLLLLYYCIILLFLLWLFLFKVYYWPMRPQTKLSHSVFPIMWRFLNSMLTITEMSACKWKSRKRNELLECHLAKCTPRSFNPAPALLWKKPTVSDRRFLPYRCTINRCCVLKRRLLVPPPQHLEALGRARARAREEP